MQSGMNTYQGDLGDAFAKWSVIYGMGLHTNVKKHVNLNFDLHFGKIVGQELSSITKGIVNTPNTFFETTYTSLSAGVRFNFIKNYRMHFFMAQRIGVIFFTPLDELREILLDKTDTRAVGETYSTTALTLPISIGANLLLDNGFGVGIGIGLSNPLTDYLDNISVLSTRNSGKDNIITGTFNLLIPLAFYKRRSKLRPKRS